MKAKAVILLFVFIFVFSFSTGCARVRTYTVEKERPDQELVSGNQGYLMGTPEETQEVRRKTRTAYVAEVELRDFSRDEKGRQDIQRVEGMTMETAEEPAGEPIMEEAQEEYYEEAEVQEEAAPMFTTYTVKPNDTLQKISMSVYGTTRKWKKIFEANKDKLKSSDKIYAGQVLRIPQD